MNRTSKRQRILQELFWHSFWVGLICQEQYTYFTLGKLGCLLNAFNNAAQRIRTDDNTVYNHLNIVLEGLSQRNFFIKFTHNTVNTNARKSFFSQIFKELDVLALATQNNRSQDIGSTSLTSLEDFIGNLICCLALNNATALRAVRSTHASIQKAQVIVDFCYSTDGRARISGSGLLVNRHSWRKTVNRVKIWLIHLSQELTGIAGQGLNVAALSLCVNGVEGKARLARTRKSRNNYQLITRDININVLQVVLSCTTDSNFA